MSKTMLSLTAIAALALGTLSATAAELDAVHGVKTVGALTLETQGLATNDLSVHRQGGFSVPGAVQWIKTPSDALRVRQAGF